MKRTEFHKVTYEKDNLQVSYSSERPKVLMGTPDNLRAYSLEEFRILAELVAACAAELKEEDEADVAAIEARTEEWKYHLTHEGTDVYRKGNLYGYECSGLYGYENSSRWYVGSNLSLAGSMPRVSTPARICGSGMSLELAEASHYRLNP